MSDTAPTAFLLPPGGGVIFDMDGLMLDTEALAKVAWQEVARARSFELDDAFFLSMIGRSRRDCAVLLDEKFGSDFDFDAIHRDRTALEENHIALHGVPLKPGARELAESLFARQIPLAVATSTSQPKANLRLEQAGMLRYFSVVVAGNEIAQGKPAPDIYLEAVRRLGVDAARSLALEDSFAGVRAAHAAGLRVIMVPDLLFPTEEIRALTVGLARSLREIQIVLDTPQPPPPQP